MFDRGSSQSNATRNAQDLPEVYDAICCMTRLAVSFEGVGREGVGLEWSLREDNKLQLLLVQQQGKYNKLSLNLAETVNSEMRVQLTV